MTDNSNLSDELFKAEEQHLAAVPVYYRPVRNQMRQLLKKASSLIDLSTAEQASFGSAETADLVDSLAAELGYEHDGECEDDVLQERMTDRYSLINLYAAVKTDPCNLSLYIRLCNLLRKYGLFEEEAALLETAVAENRFSGTDLAALNERLLAARQYRDADAAQTAASEQFANTLRNELQKSPPDVPRIKALLEQCQDDALLYEIACSTGRDEDLRSIREKAAQLIQNRDVQYALSSQIHNPSRTAMILNLYDSLEGDELFVARTILLDPKDENKIHMMLYCEDEELLMLGWKYVFGARKVCTDRLHAIGSRWPDAYMDMDPKERAEWEEMWMISAAETALDLISEDRAVQARTAGTVSTDSEPLYFFLSLQHPRKAIRWWYGKKLKNPVYIAYTGSWTNDDPVKEALSIKIRNAELITEMIFGDLSAAEPVFGFRKPEDLTLQDRFLIEIMRNHPDRTIREHVRSEVLRGNISIPGVDLTQPDPLYQRG